MPKFQKNNNVDNANNSMAKMTRLASRRNLMQMLNQQDTLNLPMQFGRHTIKDTSVNVNINRLPMLSIKQQSRISMYDKRRNSNRTTETGLELNIEEKTMVFYIVNLILFKQYNVASQIIK